MMFASNLQWETIQRSCFCLSFPALPLGLFAVPVPVYPPAGSQRPSASDAAATIRGPERHKFHTRPVVPFVQAIPAEVILAPNVLNAAANGGAGGNAAALAATQQALEETSALPKSVGIQTDYRDSQTQTDPYTADYITAPGTDPSPARAKGYRTCGRVRALGLFSVASFAPFFSPGNLESPLLPCCGPQARRTRRCCRSRT